MTAKKDVSSEFALLLNQLQQAPDCIDVKIAIIQRLPHMKALAKTDALALYRLAQLYPTHSTQYREMMEESAERGCTNAMLTLCRMLAKQPDSTTSQKIHNYLNRIEQSSDAFIKQQAAEFAAEMGLNKPQLSFFKSETAAKAPSDNYFECLAQVR